MFCLSTEEGRSMVLKISGVVVNSISLIGGISVALIIIITMILDRKLVDRVSIRLTLGISIVDIMFSIYCIFEAHNQFKGITCVLIKAFFTFITLLFVFLYVAIAVNLQLIFLYDYGFKPKWEYYYWGCTVSSSFILSFIPVCLYFLGYEHINLCRKDITLYLIDYLWEWGFHLFWVLLACIYCAGIFLLTILKLYRNDRNLKKMKAINNQCEYTLNYNKLIKKLMGRIALYCSVPIITRSFYFVFVIHAFHSQSVNFKLSLVMIITTGLPGALNFIIFLMDPVIGKSIETIKNKFIDLFNFNSMKSFHKEILPSIFSGKDNRSIYGTRPGTNIFVTELKRNRSIKLSELSKFQRDLERQNLYQTALCSHKSELLSTTSSHHCCISTKLGGGEITSLQLTDLNLNWPDHSPHPIIITDIPLESGEYRLPPISPCLFEESLSEFIRGL